MKTWHKIPTLREILGLHPEVSCILFDMDGTVFNSEPHHARALHDVLQELSDHKGLPNAKDLDLAYRGTSDSFVFEDCQKRKWLKRDIILEHFLALKNEKLVSLDTHSDASFCSPLIKKLIEEIHESHLRIGLVTNSEKSVTHAHLNQHSLFDFFELVVTREDSKAPKPDPAPYVKACQTLQVVPETTLVFEDSNAGIASAKAANTLVQKVTWYE